MPTSSELEIEERQRLAVLLDTLLAIITVELRNEEHASAAESDQGDRRINTEWLRKAS